MKHNISDETATPSEFCAGEEPVKVVGKRNFIIAHLYKLWMPLFRGDIPFFVVLFICFAWWKSCHCWKIQYLFHIVLNIELKLLFQQ